MILLKRNIRGGKEGLSTQFHTNKRRPAKKKKKKAGWGGPHLINTLKIDLMYSLLLAVT